MSPTTVIKRPIITEKSTEQSEFNQFQFEVDKRADKHQIRRAVEELYNVRVLKVATLIRKGKVRRYRYGYVEGTPTKHAVVTLHDEDRIELF